MAKSNDMVGALDTFTSGAFGMKRSDALRLCVCVSCKGDAKAFKDKLSEREFTISGLCQKCQDAFFDEADVDS